MRFLLRDRQTCAYISKLAEAIRDGCVGKMRVIGSFPAGSLLWTKETTRFGPLLAARLSSSLRRLISWRPQIKPNTCFANLECNVGSSCLTGLQLPGTLCKWRWKRINNVVVKVDFKNAFNSLSRYAMLAHLFRKPDLAPFYRLSHWIYGEESTLLVRDRRGGVVASIKSLQGVRQGCVLGSLLFASTTMDMLVDLKEQFETLEVVAYLDDVFLVGKADQCLQALDQLTREARMKSNRKSVRFWSRLSLNPLLWRHSATRAFVLCVVLFRCSARLLVSRQSLFNTGLRMRSNPGERCYLCLLARSFLSSCHFC